MCLKACSKFCCCLHLKLIYRGVFYMLFHMQTHARLKVTLCAFVVINAGDDAVLLILHSSCSCFLSGQLTATP
jgi:hypothetical protein